MIKVIFEDEKLAEHSGIKRVWDYSPTLFLDRPSLESSEDFYAFDERIHQWFVDNNITYSLEIEDYYKTVIEFEKESDAVLFKLTWL